MKVTVVQIALISLVLVMVMGVFFFANVCGAAGMSSLFGMGDCPAVIQHHLAMFMMFFAATIIAIEIIFLALVRVFVVTPSNSRAIVNVRAAQYESLNEERRNSTPSFVKQLISRGISQKREDPDSSN